MLSQNISMRSWHANYGVSPADEYGQVGHGSNSPAGQAAVGEKLCMPSLKERDHATPAAAVGRSVAVLCLLAMVPAIARAQRPMPFDRQPSRWSHTTLISASGR